MIVQAVEVEQESENLGCDWMDDQFAAMESDEDYRALQLAIAKEFALLDRETWQTGGKKPAQLARPIGPGRPPQSATLSLGVKNRKVF